MCKPCVLWSLKQTVLESCISQTLLLAETILADTPVVGQNYNNNTACSVLIGDVGGGGCKYGKATPVERLVQNTTLWVHTIT